MKLHWILGNRTEVEDTKPGTELDESTDACAACSAETKDINEAVEDSVATDGSSKSKARGDGSFEPRLLAFCCNWCSYAGADLAGVSRLQYPSNIRIIRVM